MPAMVRGARGEYAYGNTSGESYVAVTWSITGLVYIPMSCYLLNEYLLKASRNLFRFQSMSAIHKSLKGEQFGLRYHIPLETPMNLQGWIRLRSEVYRQVQEELDSIFQQERMLTSLILCTVAVAAVMFINVLEGANVNTETIFGFILLIFLSLYTMMLLLVSAYGNILINDETVAVLAAEKFHITLKSWHISDVGEVLRNITSKEKTNIYKFLGEKEFKKQKANDEGLGVDMDLGANATVRLNGPKNQIMLQQCLTSMELMLDSTISRIGNSDDLGFYISVFGVPVTFELLVSLGSALATAISGVASQITNDSTE